MTLNRDELEETPSWALSYNSNQIRRVLSVFQENADTAYTPEEVVEVLQDREEFRKKWRSDTPLLLIDLSAAGLLNKKGNYYIADGDLKEKPEEVIGLVPELNDSS